MVAPSQERGEFDLPSIPDRPSAADMRDRDGASDGASDGADLTAMVSASADAVFHLDHTGTVTRWNRAAQRMLGRSGEVMAGTVLGEVLAADAGQRWADVFAHARLGGRSEGTRFDVRCGGDQVLPALLSVSPCMTDEGFDGAWVIARDLTEQVFAQRTLAESERRVRRSEALAGTGSFVVDRAAAAVQWSYGMYTIFGVKPQDFDPSVSAHLALVHADDRAAVEAAFADALRGRPTAELDHRTAPADGHVAWVFLAVEPTRDPDGQVNGLRGVCQDVTARKETEAAARSALERERAAIEDLRRLDSVKQEFLATVSHELRTPLTVILGFSALLRATTLGQDELLEPIERNAKDMHQMVERLLDYSRIEAGRVALDLRPLPLAEQVRTIVRNLETDLVGHAAVVDIPDTLVVHADADALERILVNLISNAAKYSDSSTPIRVAAAANGPGVLVTVTDEGPGIAAEHHAHVFDRFFRVPGQTAARRGTGVGLAIVRQYVELHGGKISLQSAPGCGTTFAFDLPGGEQNGVLR